jgi:tetratricopeptide (TPR) repeat protein
MRYNHPLNLIVLCCLVFTIACSAPEKPVTKEEAANFGKELENSINQHNAAKLNNVLEGGVFGKRIMENSNNKLNKALVKGAIEGLKSGQLGDQVVQTLGDKGTYQLIKQYEKNQRQHVVFRLWGGDKLNYHDFELVKKEEQVKAADMFVYITGENLSTTLAQSLTMMGDNMSGMTSKEKGALENIQVIKMLMNKGEYERADKQFQKLPAVMKEEKLFRMIHIQIASGLSQDAYTKAINDYQQAYPDAPNMYLLMIDAYTMKKDYGKAIQAVNHLDSLIDKDPFLDYYRGLLSKMNKDEAKQREYFERLYKNMPDFAQGTIELITTYLEAKEIDKAVTITKKYRMTKDADDEVLKMYYILYPDFKKKLDATVKS